MLELVYFPFRRRINLGTVFPVKNESISKKLIYFTGISGNKQKYIFEVYFLYCVQGEERCPKVLRITARSY